MVLISRPALRIGALLLALLAVTGCEDAVDPTLGTDQAFSVYGYLDPTADRQALRVVPITETLGADTTVVLDAEVTSVEPATGRTATWRDSVVTYEDGAIGHVFVADYTPTPDTRVEITVAASDGRQSTVAVDTPPLVQPTVGAPVLVGLDETRYPVTTPGVPRVIGGRLTLYVENLPNTSGTSVLTVPLGPLQIARSGDAWTVAVPFLAATQEYLQDAGLFNRGVTLLEAEFAPFVANADWAVPEGGFDEDVVIEPGTFSNVDGGFGFVGAGYFAPVRWVPSVSAQSRAGFAVTNDPGAQIAINEVGNGYVELYNPTVEPLDVSGYIVSPEGEPGAGIRLPGGSVLDPSGFLVVDGPFSATAGAIVQFQTGGGRLLKSVGVGETVPAWGAFPDGFSYQIPRGGPNYFYGPVAPSSGASNQPEEIHAVINEVSTSGTGYVELLPLTLEFEDVKLASSGDGLQFSPVVPSGPRPFLIAEEGGGLVLDQLGGTVFLMVDNQVVDARFYGPQSPERSSGYLPDGPEGDWRSDLAPTRGASNAAARFGL